jgi:carotenoid cleavage dioxygenase
MAFTEHYAVLNDCPMFWDPDLLSRGVHSVRFFRDLTTRIGILPRRGASHDVRWFDFSPTYVLHWINAYEDGDDVVLDGFFQTNPSPQLPPDATQNQRLFRYLDNVAMNPLPWRWRMNMANGTCKEEPLSDLPSEFGTINSYLYGAPHRYCYSTICKPGWFLFTGLRRTDLFTGEVQDYNLPEGVYASEAPMVPRDGSKAEDDGYVVTFTTDVNRDCSECLVFDAGDLAAGPIARVQLPERISSGTHAFWGSLPDHVSK